MTAASTEANPRPTRVSAVVVTYREIELTLAAIGSLKAQTVPVDEIIVVDNDPAHSIREPMRATHPDVRLLNENNPGYAPACNRGAAIATGEWLFFLNPDVEVEPDCLQHLLAVPAEQPNAGIITPQVLLPDGQTVNAGENQIHLTGVAWCGRYGEPAETGPSRPVFITTGAAMLVRRDLYEALDGYCDDFFLYYEDPDLCWRAWVVGSEVWYVPQARIRHHYAWGTSRSKWFYLERHRLLSVLTNFRLSTVLVLAPLLLGTELVLLLVAAQEGWFSEKLRAYGSVWERRGWIRARRHRLEAMRARPDAEIIPRFRATIDSPQVQSDLPRKAAPLLRIYKSVAVGVVRALGR